MKKESVLICGIVGNRKRGKTFILSQLSGVKFQVGIETGGISIKYPKMNEEKMSKYILMDTAGFENELLKLEEFAIPKSKGDEKLLRLEIMDKICTEYFIQKFVVQKSDILIVVIDNIFNYSEQKLLNKIKNLNVNKFKNQTPPPIYIIHNLKKASFTKQVEEYIKKILYELKSFSFKLKEMLYQRTCSDKVKTINDKYFIESPNDYRHQNEIVYHLILAKQGTEAGDYYNQFTYEFLSDKFDSFHIHKKFPIIEDVKDQLIRCSEKIMIHPIESLDDFEKSESEIKLMLKDKNEEEKDLYFNRDFIRDIRYFNFSFFEPKYLYFKIIIDKVTYACIEIEIPGESKIRRCEAEMHEEYWNIYIKGNKILGKIQTEDESTLYSKSKEGEFNLVIKLKDEDFPLADKRPDRRKTTKVNGLNSYYFRLVGEKESSENEEDNK